MTAQTFVWEEARIVAEIGTNTSLLTPLAQLIIEYSCERVFFVLDSKQLVWLDTRSGRLVHMFDFPHADANWIFPTKCGNGFILPDLLSSSLKTFMYDSRCKKLATHYPTLSKAVELDLQATNPHFWPYAQYTDGKMYHCEIFTDYLTLQIYNVWDQKMNSMAYFVPKDSRRIIHSFTIVKTCLWVLCTSTTKLFFFRIDMLNPKKLSQLGSLSRNTNFCYDHIVQLDDQHLIMSYFVPAQNDTLDGMIDGVIRLKRFHMQTQQWVDFDIEIQGWFWYELVVSNGRIAIFSDRNAVHVLSLSGQRLIRVEIPSSSPAASRSYACVF